jgi:outer membrane protein OmpT
MKKTLLALAVFAAASSVNAAEIYKSDEASVGFYGQLCTDLKFLEDKDAKLDSGSSRMGVDAAYAINDSVKVHGLVEISVRHSDSKKVTAGEDDLYIRKHLLGFSGDFGKVIPV